MINGVPGNCKYVWLWDSDFSGLMWLDMHTIDLGHCFENEFNFESIPVIDNRVRRA